MLPKEPLPTDWRYSHPHCRELAHGVKISVSESAGNFPKFFEVDPPTRGPTLPRRIRPATLLARFSSPRHNSNFVILSAPKLATLLARLWSSERPAMQNLSFRA